MQEQRNDQFVMRIQPSHNSSNAAKPVQQPAQQEQQPVQQPAQQGYQHVIGSISTGHQFLLSAFAALGAESKKTENSIEFVKTLCFDNRTQQQQIASHINDRFSAITTHLSNFDTLPGELKTANQQIDSLTIKVYGQSQLIEHQNQRINELEKDLAAATRMFQAAMRAQVQQDPPPAYREPAPSMPIAAPSMPVSVVEKKEKKANIQELPRAVISSSRIECAQKAANKISQQKRRREEEKEKEKIDLEDGEIIDIIDDSDVSDDMDVDILTVDSNMSMSNQSNQSNQSTKEPEKKRYRIPKRGRLGSYR
jgi:hypothetical protein